MNNKKKRKLRNYLQEIINKNNKNNKRTIIMNKTMLNKMSNKKKESE
jgi:hypothetical protein